MSVRLIKANEIESITALSAKSFARVLEAEKKRGQRRYPRDAIGLTP